MKQRLLLFGLLYNATVACGAENPPAAQLTPETTAKPATVSASPINQSANSVPPSTAPQTAVDLVPPKAVPAATAITPVIAAPADIASLTAKEILAANNQVVGQIGALYQHLGLYLTIVISVFALLATIMGYLAKRSVSELVTDWRNQFKEMERETVEATKRLKQATDEAEGSAKRATKQAEDINASANVLNTALEELDRLRSEVSALAMAVHSNVKPAAPPPSVQSAAETTPQSDAEADKLSDMLKGKTGPSNGAAAK